MYRLCLPVLLIFLCAAPGRAQTESCGFVHHTQSINRESRSGLLPVLGGTFADASLNTQLNNGYMEFGFRRQTSTAQAALHAAIDLAVARKNRCAEGLAAFGLAMIAQQADVAGATIWLRQAEAAFEEAHSKSGLAHVHFALASAAARTRPEKESQIAFTTTAEEFDRSGEPVEAVGARLEAILPSSPDAPAEFAHLAATARALHAPDVEARAFHRWGDAEFSLAQYDHAMRHYQQSDALYTSCRCDFNQRAYVQTSMGRMERAQGRPRVAIDHYRLALRLQAKGHDRAYMPQTLNAISVAYEAMARYATAIVYLQRALSDARAIHSQQFIDFLEPSLGYLYYQAGQPRRGLPLLERATAHTTSDYRLCVRYDQISELYLVLKESKKAEDRSTRAIAACESAKDKSGLASSLEERARIRLLRGELEGALSDARQSLVLVEQIRAHLVPEDAHKRGYNEKTLNLYKTTIAILTRMNRYPEALEVTEQARARAFLDLLSSPHAPIASAGAEQSTQGKVSLKSVSALRGGSDSSPLGSELLLASASHVASMHTADMVAMAEHLHTTMLAYWISKDALSIWVVRPGQPVYGVSRPVRPAQIEALVRAVNPFESSAGDTRGLRTRGGQTVAIEASHRETWKKLYRLLIQPVEAQLPKEPGSLLTIVPYGPLFQLPFAALIDGQNRYLVERYALHTVPAVGLLSYTEKNEAAARRLPPHYLFVANPQHFPQLPHGYRLPALPETDVEVKAIAQALPADEVTLLEGDRADVAHLVKALPQATLLHFATHAIVSDSDPFGSFLALDHHPDRSPAGDENDGLLTTSDIYQMHLHTLMVVLSACRTGRGPISGDGVAGLSRAFFYAGSASVLTTLWDVADAPTALLMPLLYQGLQRGESRSTALRNAQLALIDQLRRHRVKVRIAGKEVALPERPVFWAAFSLSGQP
ncbi:MAG: CHAT domain-containing tetratricopeptide repeat protein [Edaphobacter sp.]